jgi:hypothetical protein
MKAIISAMFVFLSLNGYSQCRNTFLYGFELVGNVNPNLITATVTYKGKTIVPKTKTICGKPFKIKPTFTYLKNSAKVLNNVKMPYQLPANRFYWLMTDEMNIEMAIYPDNFKIVLNSKDQNTKDIYELPITYDFVSQNTIYLDLIDKSESNIQKTFKDNIWQFAVFKKEITPAVKDTILIFSAKKNIPAGIKIRFPEINEKTVHSMEEYTTLGMLFNGKLFLKIPESKTPKPDQHIGLYTSIDGKKCATSGGITGAGFGECAGATVQKNKKPIQYKIDFQIEP